MILMRFLCVLTSEVRLQPKFLNSKFGNFWKSNFEKNLETKKFWKSKNFENQKFWKPNMPDVKIIAQIKVISKKIMLKHSCILGGSLRKTVVSWRNMAIIFFKKNDFSILAKPFSKIFHFNFFEKTAQEALRHCKTSLEQHNIQANRQLKDCNTCVNLIVCDVVVI